MSLLDRLFRRRVREVAGIDRPTRVEVACRVASPNSVVSPVTGTAAALIRWTLLEERTIHSSRGGSERGYRVLARGLYEDAPLIFAAEGKGIEVPVTTVRWVLVEDPEDGELLIHVPPSLREVVASHSTGRALAYREAYLRQGDPIELTATLERIRADAGRGYREPGARQPTLRALTEDRIVVRELGYGG